jgi:cytochrome c biogenesis protein CcmG/thiol:disulfide interchange protein DsbE
VKEHPELQYVGLDVADTEDRAEQFVRRYGWTWPSIVDPQRRRAKKLGAEYQPFVAVIDADGRIVATHAGGGEKSVWEGLIERLPEER